MPKDTPSKPPARSGAVKRPQRGRRSVVRPADRSLRGRINDLAQHPILGWGIGTAVVFALVCGMIAAWARENPLVTIGQVMNETRTVRVAFTAVDEAETERNRETARQRTPRVYTAGETAFEEIRNSLLNLPHTLAGVSSVDRIDRAIREQFRLNDLRLQALRQVAESDDAYQDWVRRVDALDEILRRRPMLDGQTWQRTTQEGLLATRMELRSADQTTLEPRNAAINLDDRDRLATEVATISRVAGFSGQLADVVQNRLLINPRPTYRFDAAATQLAQSAAVENVRPVVHQTAVGQIIYDRGEVLKRPQHELYRQELEHFRASAGAARIWLGRASVFGAVGVVTLLLTGYIATFCPRIARRPSRMLWAAGLLAAALGTSCALAVLDPRFIMLGAVAPTVLVAIFLCIAYDQRTALAISAVLGVLVCVALSQPVGFFAILLTGIAAAVWRLREIRDRRTLVHMSLIVGASLAAATLVVGLLDRPVVGPAIRETVIDAGLAGFGGILAGGAALFMLPWIERIFDITTGMTLIELRDPKVQLMKEMQQRAPGTYNHALNVASISEAAAESIGANSLLTYVGCLYHDIGKINKPEYFVENQSGGPNKHDKLSPAMSLLVIVGHVKDGLEMAREYGLPRSLRHFIEAHHGTTLVEYFYNRARKQAKTVGAEGRERPSTGEPVVDHEEERLPDEVDYRYPGPKPRTKEVAILMLADAVESATRTLAEPTPSRIDALVRDLANKRLMDGQFDECDLTLRELQTIADSISKSVASIYHGRVVYPGAGREEKTRDTAMAEEAAERSA